MNPFPPNIDPQTFSITAVLVGIASIGDYTANELDSISNWLFLVAQYIETVSVQQTLIEGRMDKNNININSKKYKSGGSPYTSYHNKSNQYTRDELELLIDAVSKMQRELENLKRNRN